MIIIVVLLLVVDNHLTFLKYITVIKAVVLQEIIKFLSDDLNILNRLKQMQIVNNFFFISR